jgi:hypothetical protein
MTGFLRLSRSEFDTFDILSDCESVVSFSPADKNIFRSDVQRAGFRKRIEVRVFIAFPAYCLRVTPDADCTLWRRVSLREPCSRNSPPCR